MHAKHHAGVYHASRFSTLESEPRYTDGASRLVMRTLPAPLGTSFALLLANFAAGCSSGSGDDQGFTTFTTFTTQPTTTLTSLGDGDGDDESGDADNGDGDGDDDPGDGDGDMTTGGDVCGDGIVGPTESCDGNNLAGETCMSQGFTGGTLGCAIDCNDFDVGGCTNSDCGNGIIDNGELCDGPELNGQTCVSIGYAGGQLACNPNCLSFNVSGCVESMCGNGVVDPGESCDGNNLNGQSCLSQGFAGGNLACNGSCTGFNTAGCFDDDGDCCIAHAYVGCQDAGITACVCGLDPYCCNTEWDSLCVDQAILDCGAVC
jgi:hypothetical protein